MVFVKADAITLFIDNSFSIKLDSSLLLTNLSSQVFLAVARLDEDAFFLSVSLQYSENDNVVSWEVKPIVKPLISQIRIRPENEDTYTQRCMDQSILGTTEVERSQSYPIILTPGKSHHISENIIVHLLSRSRWPDNEEGATKQRRDPREWVFADRYHVLSSWFTNPGTQTRDGNLYHSISRDNGTGLREIKPMEVAGDAIRARPHCETYQERAEHTTLMNSQETNLDEDDDQDNEAIARENSAQSNWLQDLKKGLWDILEITRLVLLDSLAPTSSD